MEYTDALNRYRDLAASLLDAPVKGKANPHTSIDGNMFSFLDRSGTICIRLSKADREAFMAEFAAPPVEQYGTVMKDYVSVPHAVLDQPERIERWFRLCLQNAKRLSRSQQSGRSTTYRKTPFLLTRLTRDCAQPAALVVSSFRTRHSWMRVRGHVAGNVGRLIYRVNALFWGAIVTVLLGVLTLISIPLALLYRPLRWIMGSPHEDTVAPEVLKNTS